MVATAWYEQGIRFLDVSDPRNIEQKAFYMPEGATMWAAYWAPNAENIVYAVDNTARADRRAAASNRDRGRREPERLRLRWPAHWFDGQTDAVEHAKFGWVCRLRRRLDRLVVERAPEVERRQRPVRPPRLADLEHLAASGIFFRPYARSTARLIPRSPTGSTSGRPRWKIRNMSAVHWPRPFTAVSCAVTSSSGSLEGGRARARPTRRARPASAGRRPSGVTARPTRTSSGSAASSSAGVGVRPPNRAVSRS